jgi:hypothetical protein
MKYRFEIYYANKNMQQVSRLMARLDLSMEGTAVKNVITFTAGKTLDIGQIKDLIAQAYESAECLVYTIEGGKIE